MHGHKHKFTNIQYDIKILHYMKKGIKLNTLENIEIQQNIQCNDNNLNDKNTINNNILFSLIDN